MSEHWGKYELTSLIARGGMAEVFRAEQLGPSGFVRTVCLKCVRSEYSNDPQFVSMFESEARIVATLQHPNVVHILDFDRHEGRLYLVMELVDGWDLRHILGRATQLGLRLPLGVALRVLEGLLLALEHAHTRSVEGVLRPVVHRDVSPHNVLVSVEGAVKLTDFGIAKARGLSDATRTGIVKGKLAYLSPEQARGEVASPLSDLFSAGLVAQELLTGERALAGEDDRAVAAQLHNWAPPTLVGVPEPIASLVGRLLAREPSERFRCAREALQCLGELNIPLASMHEVGRMVFELRQLPAAPAAVADNASNSFAGAAGPQDDAVPETRISSPQAAVPRPQTKRLGAVFAMLLGLTTAVAVVWWMRQDVVVATPAPAPVYRQPVTPPQPAVPANEPAAIRTLAPTQPPTASVAEPAPATSLPAPEARQAPRFGALSVYVRPWANVVVDGVSRGQTPLKNLRLEAGAHRLVLANEELSYKKNLQIEIEGGEHEVVNRVISR